MDTFHNRARRRLFIGLSVAGVGLMLLPGCSSSQMTRTTHPWERQVLAANDGWAAAEGGTSGGAHAQPGFVFEVRNRAELVAALAVGTPGTPRIVRVLGRIDLCVDSRNRPVDAEAFRDPAFDFEAYLRAYAPAVWGKQPPTGPLEAARQRSADRQQATVVVPVPSNTTVIGVGRDAGFKNGTLLLQDVDNVIVRNLHFSDAYDHFPAWDPKDNANGEWNSEYDNLSLSNATHVWVDHCTFDDGTRPDHTARTALGRPMQHHDGLLDITARSNWVTVSYCHFRGHDKTNLVGNSDQSNDSDRLKVSFHHNWWEHCGERAPRVRFGQVHVYNNLYTGSDQPPYPLGYSIGVGVQSRLVVQNNVWETPAHVPATRLVRLWRGQVLAAQDNWHNGRPVDLLAALQRAHPGVALNADVGWMPSWHGPIDPVAEVAHRVRAQAGAGRT
ncbi:pectate lyase family protein [Hydrogenophaga sp. OTU3427]|uniref:pectate lyase family protein n=1 Tax=Hydrogenophaga sp. OTU3427 TaxID=3043856 RepID=UPI00313BA2E1